MHTSEYSISFRGMQVMIITLNHIYPEEISLDIGETLATLLHKKLT